MSVVLSSLNVGAPEYVNKVQPAYDGKMDGRNDVAIVEETSNEEEGE